MFKIEFGAVHQAEKIQFLFFFTIAVSNITYKQTFQIILATM